jgi:hypothetical protein
MNKPAGYDSAKPEVFETLEIKPFIGTIVDVLDNPSASGNEMLTFHLDTQDGFFTKKFSRNNKPGKKWQFCMYRVINEQNMGRLKGDIESIEKSNNGFVFDWNDIKKAVGLKIGVNPRNEEYVSQSGDINISPKPFYFFPIQDISKQKVLADKKVVISETKKAETPF